MSLAMRQARYAVGDPGLFGSIFKGITGAVGGFITGGPAGAITGAAKGVISSMQPKPISVAKVSPFAVATRGGMFPTPPPQGTPGFSGVSVGGPSGVRIGTSTPAPVVMRAAPGVGAAPYAGAPLSAAASGACQLRGYHLNHHAYYDSKGYHPEQSVCVKNRRRNPLNPRALSRAMSRVKSAQRAVRCLQLFAGPAARAAAKGGGRRKVGRSCKGCR
jgi:hypothetical protein